MINTKPFIKLFKTPLGFYCYDVNSLSILRISGEVYKALAAEQENIPKQIENEIIGLKEKGYLLNHRPKEIKHPYTDILESYFDSNIKKITLQITQNCNLSCKYCAYANPIEGKQRHHENKSMPLELAKKGVNFLFEHSKNEKDVCVGFYGGEPLLEFDKIRKIIKYSEKLAEQYDKQLTFALTTNATLFTDEMIEYFSKHNINILISLDGPRDIHDKNRVYRQNGKGSFQDVMNNLGKIQKKYPEFVDQLSINTVLDCENNFSCYNDFFTDYDFVKEISLSANTINKQNLSTKFSSKDAFATKYNYEKFKLFLSMLGVIKKNDVSKLLHVDYGTYSEFGKSINNSYIMIEYTVHHGGPCIAGSSRLFMDVNGEFFPCERCSESSEVMHIGNIDLGINLESVSRIINIGKITENECKNCWSIKHCLICAVLVDDITKFSREKKLLQCKRMKKNNIELIYDFLTLIEFDYDYNIKY